VKESYLLARLLPHVRSLGSRGVVADSRLSNRRKAVIDGRSMLEASLRADPLTPLTEVQFHAGTKRAIGPDKMAPEAVQRYLQFEETLLTEPCNRLPQDPEASMRPVPSGRTTESGRKYHYTHYVCPRAVAGACDNGRYVREDHLREAVVSRLRAHLFPPPDEPGRVPDWFPDLVSLVRQELERYHAAEPDRAAVRAAELHQIRDHLAGWVQSLEDPKLPTSVRADITALYEQAKLRQAELEAQIETGQALDGHLAHTLKPEAVLNQLHHLGNVLAGHNATLCNLELSRHIESILCFPNGRVEMRGTWLGVLDGIIDLLSRSTEPYASPRASAADSACRTCRQSLTLQWMGIQALIRSGSSGWPMHSSGRSR
jgi:hypothetical protein